MFTHLHTHSYYSFLDGIPSPAQLVQAAVRQGMQALALTDHHGLTGAIEFYDACQQAGIKPILGIELVVNHNLGQGNLILLAMDQTGWTNLCRLSSIVQSAHHRDPNNGINFARFAENTAGLICLSGGKRGLGQHLIDKDQTEFALTFFGELQNIFPQSLYVELQSQRPADRRDLHSLTAIAEHLKLPVVATNNVHYLNPEQASLQRTLTAMRLNTELGDIPLDAPAPPGSHFASRQEMIERFADYPAALANTQKIAARCNLELPLGVPHYPEIPLASGETAVDRLRKLAEKGAKQRYGEITPEIQSRLDYELTIIDERDYAPLFIIVQEILEFARRTNVPISSRGSAASSLVAHCLGITSPDPLALNLYFERFLNPARSSPPDIDTDLCSLRRDAVIRHVYEQYGEDRVAMVATINRFRRRSALREVAKVHGLSPKEIKTLVADLPTRGWGPPSRRNAHPAGDPYQALQARFPNQRYKAIFQDAQALLKFPRHLSVHPGGIVITPGPITDLVPTHLASKGMLITQFNLESIERMGLVKIDLLGTRGLTVLGNVADRIQSWRRREFESGLDVLDAIPEDDPKTIEWVRSAQTIGCFAIESPGMRATLKEIDAHSLDDIMVALALYRPGPLTGGLKDAFVQRHLGNARIEHIHPALVPLLKSTHGVILYQEQVLRIASELAGLSLADADLLRRAMSHFDPGERMKTLKQRFIAGALEKSAVPSAIAGRIWDMMAAFAGYGFPKAHAASYAQVAWRSVWCKAHYPAEFMAAVLAGWGGYYRQPVYLNEARRLGLTLRGPHIHHSQYQFTVVYPKGMPILYMGLAQVSGLSRRTQQRILTERPFRSLEDFLTRVDPRLPEVENLIRIGALSSLGTIPDLLAKVQTGGWRYAQPPLFELGEHGDAEDWDLPTRMDAQKTILGTSVDAHPLELVSAQLQKLDTLSTLEAANRLEEQIAVAGVRQTSHRFHNLNGENYYMIELLDLDGVLPVRMTVPFYSHHRRMLSTDQLVVVEGRMIKNQETGTVILDAQKLWPLAAR